MYFFIFSLDLPISPIIFKFLKISVLNITPPTPPPKTNWQQIKQTNFKSRLELMLYDLMNIHDCLVFVFWPNEYSWLSCLAWWIFMYCIVFNNYKMFCYHCCLSYVCFYIFIESCVFNEFVNKIIFHGLELIS